MYNDVFSGVYDCEKTISPKGVCYKYIDENSIKNEIYFFDEKVLMNRKGAISTKQTYILNGITKSLYKTPHITTELEIKTLYLEKKNKGFLLEYELYNGGSLLNKIKLEFNEK